MPRGSSGTGHWPPAPVYIPIALQTFLNMCQKYELVDPQKLIKKFVDQQTLADNIHRIVWIHKKLEVC